MTSATMFLNNVTIIDYAYVSPGTGAVYGGSLNVHVEVTGEVDDHEAVVVDFSTIKKDIKALIDDNETGFDHKLWITEDLIENSHFSNVQTTDRRVTYTQGDNRIGLPTNAVRFMDNVYKPAEMISDYLFSALHAKYPGLIDLHVTLDQELQVPAKRNANCITFRYVHGLKNSTSWGCQNIAHGHSSFAYLEHEDGSRITQAEMDALEGFLHKIDDSIFVWRDNIVDPNPQFMTLVYETDQRGLFYFKFDMAKNRCIILDTETTIENIASWVATQLAKYECIPSGTRVFVSEGLSKGAVSTIHRDTATQQQLF